ncbi:MAG: beta-L-arabinofuranosidase domain-containing protein [Ferruginibacter sp.]
MKLKLLAFFLLLMFIKYSKAQITGIPAIAPMPQNAVRLNQGRLLDQLNEVKTFYLGINDASLLKGFLLRKGIDNGASEMGGWYSKDIFNPFGQFVSGLYRLYAATGDIACKTKADYLVQQWSTTIDGPGSPRGEGYFFYTNNSGFSHYVYDKMVGALVDAYVFGGNADALNHLSKITDWAVARLDRSRPYAGGGEWYTLSENLYRAYMATNNINYKNFAGVWEYTEYWNYYKNNTDPFVARPGVFYHAYSHLNTMSGAGAAFLVKNDPAYKTALVNCYNYFMEKQNYVTGGYGPNEALQPNAKALAAIMPETKKHFETQCGSWAAFKMSEYLVAITGDGRYGDWIEKLIYNGIGASIPMSPDGRVMYCSDYKAHDGVKENLPGPDEQWPCCSGTRPQAIAEYVNMIYFRKLNNSGLYVNLYVPSNVNFNGIILTQTTTYPESPDVIFTVAGTPMKAFTMYFRKPEWLTGKAEFSINGKSIATPAVADGWYPISRAWANGDKIKLSYPMNFALKRVNLLTEYPVALTYGPVVMAAKVTDGTHYPATMYQTPAGSNLTPVLGQALVFNSTNLPGQMVQPFYSYRAGEPYIVYLDTVHANAIPMRNFKTTGDPARWWGFAGTSSITTNKPGNAITFTFYGAGLKLSGAKYWDGGQFSVNIDGALFGIIDEYKSGAINQYWEKSFTGLTQGKHTVTLTMLATKTTTAATPYCNFGRSFTIGLMEWEKGAITSGTYEISSYITGIKSISKSIGNAQFGPKATEDMKWMITSIGNSEYSIVNATNGKALDAGAATSGSSLSLQSPSSNISQKWKITQVGSNPVYQIKPGKNPGLGASIKDGSTASGARVELGSLASPNSYFLLYNLNGEARVAEIANEPMATTNKKSTPGLIFSVYPNPSNGRFTLEADIHTDEKFEVKIFSLTGREVYSIEGNGKITKIIDLSTVIQATDHFFVAKLFAEGKIYHYKILTPQ